MKNLASLKSRFGAALIELGANLYFKDDEQTQKLKRAINENTTIGSYAESGDHIRGHVKPMCDYDTQSVVNVLRQGKFCENASETSKREAWYSESWL